MCLLLTRGVIVKRLQLGNVMNTLFIKRQLLPLLKDHIQALGMLQAGVQSQKNKAMQRGFLNNV